MPKPISAVCTALILVLAVAAVAAEPVRASQRTANEAVMLQLINHARAQRGLAPLHVHAALSRAALAHSRDMMRHDYFSHASPCGASCATRARRAGYATSGCRLWAVSEVIGWGRSSHGTPHAIFSSWMRSAYHRSIILGRRWRDVGVGCVSGTFAGASGSWMYTVDVGRPATNRRSAIERSASPKGPVAGRTSVRAAPLCLPVRLTIRPAQG